MLPGAKVKLPPGCGEGGKRNSWETGGEKTKGAQKRTTDRGKKANEGPTARVRTV